MPTNDDRAEHVRVRRPSGFPVRWYGLHDQLTDRVDHWFETREQAETALHRLLVDEPGLGRLVRGRGRRLQWGNGVRPTGLAVGRAPGRRQTLTTGLGLRSASGSSRLGSPAAPGNLPPLAGKLLCLFVRNVQFGTAFARIGERDPDLRTFTLWDFSTREVRDENGSLGHLSSPRLFDS
jgi:hypothetical protein